MRIRLVFIALGALVLASGCGDGDGPPLPQDYDPTSTSSHPLLVMNSSQFPVLELYVHEDPEDTSGTNELSEDLPIDGQLVLDSVRGIDYLTYVRTERGLGDRYSITTDAPLGVSRDGFALMLFDEGFRLLTPQHPDNPLKAGP